MRSRSPFSLLVWFGVAVVLALAIVLAVELNQATGRSKTALGLGKLNGVYGLAHDATTSEERRQMLRGGDRAYASERRVVEFARIEVALGFIVFGALWLILRAARNEKFERLAEMASADPLTGLRNHRVFHEDLARELQRTSRTGVPAGLLHDVGKIGITDAILNKPAALTADEYEVMKSHAQPGYEIVEAAGLFEQAQWVRHDHERIDGRGYPDDLAGEEIPLESRIILVADAFEAMTSNRPYRRAPGREFALEELQRGAGSQFEPAVVDALTRVLERTGEPALTAQ